ncbi:MAG TPA: adenylyltransferase/cytidyltransferase family protein [Chitinophagales bacterium]|nr:adenylyltransferase/cytidyltransferase family protein [Chitinophagales bacterium]
MLNNSPKIIFDLETFLTSFERKNKTIVFTNGCFDLLHKGHLHLVKEAKKLGDILIVAVNDDASVKKLKGETRPIENIETRLNNLSVLDEVDYLISFSEETPIRLIEKIKPTILVKGGDYKKEHIVGKEFAQQVVIVPLLEGFSTTNQINK